MKRSARGSGLCVLAVCAVSAWAGSSPIAATRPNHLQGQTSPYLLQHVQNPVDWYPWGEQALRKAGKEDKPIFLSIGYSACHWCHVMEREAFSDASVARFLNEHFVSIKVDREERPDLDALYMSAVLAITGRGGWPMTVFLTPERKPFFGGTYFPTESFQKTGDAQALDMVTRTLDALDRGGIHDQIGGGFHRYSTDEKWLQPHFEKMLYDNALLVPVYLEAWKAGGGEEFRRVAEETI